MHRFVSRSAVLPGIAGASIALLLGSSVMHPTSAQAAGSRTASAQATAAATSYDLQVASYNISGVINDAGAPYKWDKRRSKVARQLLGINGVRGPQPDVVALQEANSTKKLSNGRTQYTDLVAWLNHYATGGATYATINDASVSTRITYDSSAVSVVDHGVIMWDQQDDCDGNRAMPWAIFQIKATGDRFFFGSDHLETCNETVRRAQWGQLLRDVPRLADNLPTVFAGDFNSTRGATYAPPRNPTGSVMLPKMADAGYRDTMGQTGAKVTYVTDAPASPNVVNGNFNSANKFDRILNHYTDKGSRTMVGQSIDYIFASRSLRVKNWEMVFDARKTGADTWRLYGIIPSDHNMIRATITIP